MKQCSKCKEWKDKKRFSADKSKKDKLYSSCKDCENNKQKKIYQDNKKSKLEYAKKYRENNIDKIIKYRNENKKYFLEYYENNKEEILKIQKIHYENNKEEKKERYKSNKNEKNKKKKEYQKSQLLWNSKYHEKISLYEKIRQVGNYLEVKCTYCGKWHVPKVSEIQHRLSSINKMNCGESRLYCSNNCKKECPVFQQKKWPKGFKKATSREVQPELRQLVLERDNYTCQKCGLNHTKLKVGLHCHHKEGIHWEPIESADLDMCITLCKNCHKEVHKLPGCGYNDMKCEK